MTQQNSKTTDFDTMLRSASRQGSVGLAQEALQAGAKTTGFSNKDNPLYIALKGGHKTRCVPRNFCEPNKTITANHLSVAIALMKAGVEHDYTMAKQLLESPSPDTNLEYTNNDYEQAMAELELAKQN